MGRSRRAFKKSNPTVRVGLPKRKNPKSLTPETLTFPGTDSKLQWDGKASLLENYKSMGILANPNVVGARSGTRHVVQLVSLQKPLSDDGSEVYGSDDEPDDVKSVLHKKRKDGKKAPLQRLTTMQRVYISRLILKHGDDYVAMSKDMKLNKMQHPPGALGQLCERFQKYEKLADYTEKVDSAQQ
ncbi:uncharacterized protein [Physcomitrium patens]|uniref:Nucleolar protein 16 n=1 Tax=Physcomitrium patens TaxID=3218 RepID=A9U003_PHYPA|nr:uncharacterized protein LOC112277203 [Physcomitrium patens]PNR27240.1 hypothetical protein PHYPA_029392 [Physcomitrium patens]|eukprot:XP_024365043.1 uncharacterized protein LOC112277203 [Physcomitrella patens]